MDYDYLNEVITGEPLMRPGVNFTTRAELKYARATHLANELRGRIDEWSAAETLVARIVRVDEHTVEFRMVARSLPPIDEWSLILGDALHNLRSGFDNLVWALATANGSVPKVPGRVMFPITRTEAEWKARLRHLETVDPVFIERIRKLQPWAEQLAYDESLLGLLHHFDGVDKHRGLIAGQPHFRSLMLAGLDWNYPQGTQLPVDLTYETRQTPVAIADDMLLMTVRCATTSLRPDPEFLAKVDTQFFIAWDELRVLPMEIFMGDLLAGTRSWLDRLYGGDRYAAILAESRKADRASAVTVSEKAGGGWEILSIPMTTK